MNQIRLHIWGDYACFTRPEMKVERVSYDVITPCLLYTSALGVHSLKIEGRTKSFYYCARTAQVYRKAIDDAAAGKPFDESLMDTLESLSLIHILKWLVMNVPHKAMLAH